MLPLMPTAALKAGEVVAAEPEPVLLARGVEVPAGVEPEPEPEPAEEEPAGEELVAVTEAEPDEEPDEEPVADAEEEDSPVLVLPLPVEVAVALVSEGALLEVEVVPAAVVVSTGGTTMGWPAEEHWETTALDTAAAVISGKHDRWVLIQHTDLVRDVASLLDAGSNGADKSRLLAVAGEVGQGRAAISGQSSDEAVELEAMSEMNTTDDRQGTHRAAGNVGKLSVGQAGSNEGNESGGELHFDD